MTPQPAFKKTVGLAMLNGWSVVVVASLSILLALAFRDLTALFAAALAAFAGAMEVRGGRMLRCGDARGLNWAIRGEGLLLGVILLYCLMRVTAFGREVDLERFSPELRMAVEQLQLSQAELKDLLRKIVLAFYSAVALASCIYQGGMMVYYRSRKARLVEVLAVSTTVELNQPPVL